MTTKLSREESARISVILGRLDKVAAHIQDNYKTWGMSFETARAIVNDLDKTADEIEVNAFGPESLQKRQHEVCAKVIQRDADEPYMQTFENPMKPIKTDADEPYMRSYADDQSSAVEGGKSTTGRPLAP